MFFSETIRYTKKLDVLNKGEKVMKKKMLTGILAALMVVSVTGCSSVTDAVLGLN